MYNCIFLGIDGSNFSELAIEAAISIAENVKAERLIGCHVYASTLHRARFLEMEKGLPDRYQNEDELSHLRNTHENLIDDGLELISNAYFTNFIKLANQKSLSHEEISEEGRNYSKLLEIIQQSNPDLVILGAQGQGAVPEETIGSVTERIVTLHKDSDILLMRQPWNLHDFPIVVGVDGSEESFAALNQALTLAKIYGSEVHAIAVYDPFFHLNVFKNIEKILPPADQQKFNFSAQESLHDEIIDKGLEKLYAEGLERGKLLANSIGVPYNSKVISGKVFAELFKYAETVNAGLIVMGRWGRHKEAISEIGSNTLKLARLTKTNILIIKSPTTEINLPELPQTTEITEIEWDPSTAEIVERIPKFVRKMAKKSIEQKAQEEGIILITPEFIRSAMPKFGMGKRK